MQLTGYIEILMVRIIQLPVIMLSVMFGAYAQDIEFSASAPPSVAVGEQFRLTYSLNSRGSNLILPDLENFRLIAGPSTSSSSSVQIINGEMTRTQSTTFTYILQATEVGDYTIAPATINVGPDQYTSNPVEIEVLPDSQGRSAAPGRQQSPDPGVSPGDIAGEDLFVRLILNKDEVYQGEALVATIKLYSKLDLTGIENVRFPAFSGFYQQDIETPPLRSLDREVINGEIYGTGVLKQLILFPQRSGEITVEPFEMDALVRHRTGRRGSVFDDFFGGFETRRVPVRSQPLTIDVNPLPGQRPPGFNGAVGEYSINLDIDPGEIKTNEAVNLKLTISGKGNLKLLGKPEINFPPGFEVYDPGITENIRNSGNGQEGSITFDYLMIPRTEGNFRIPPVEFSYFNPSEKNFRTIRTEELSLPVLRGEDTEAGTPATGFSREDLLILGRDIRFIKTGKIVLYEKDRDIFGSFRFYLWFIIPFILFIVVIIIQRKNIRDRADISMMKRRRASKVARRRLKIAGRYLEGNDHHRFFEEMLKALWGYLSDKLLIPVSELNRENAVEALLEKQVPEKDAEMLMGIISECEFARYAPLSASGDMKRIYGDTLKVITLVEQNIRQ